MKYNFRKLVDLSKLQELTDELYLASSIPSAIITMDGEVLTGSGWQRICTDFHRQHPQIEQMCIGSDIKIRKELSEGEPFVIYKCPRGLVDASSPVIIDGEHVANVFAGQVFLDIPNEITEQFFREQARTFGFDEIEYMNAFREIPIFPKEKFMAALSFLSKLAKLIAELGFIRLRELEAMEALKVSEDKFRLLFNSANDSVFVHQPSADGKPRQFLEINDIACNVYGYNREEFLELTPADLLPSEQAPKTLQLIT
jgi:ligand-binding sensor protein